MKILKFIKNFILLILSLLTLILALIFLPSITSVLLIVLTFLLIPIPKIINITNRLLPKPILKVAVIIILIILTFILLPSSPSKPASSFQEGFNAGIGTDSSENFEADPQNTLSSNDIASTINGSFSSGFSAATSDESFSDSSLSSSFGENANDSLLTNINVTFSQSYIDEQGLHIKVHINNTSEDIFAGDVHVHFFKADGITELGSDMIIVDKILPGQESYANIIVDAYDGEPQLMVNFANVSFSPVKESTAQIDEEATNKTKENFYWSFYDVSWYDDVTEITVYEDGTCIVAIKTDSKNDGLFYASTIWGCGNDLGVVSVHVVDSNGTTLAVFEK